MTSALREKQKRASWRKGRRLGTCPDLASQPVSELTNGHQLRVSSTVGSQSMTLLTPALRVRERRNLGVAGSATEPARAPARAELDLLGDEVASTAPSKSRWASGRRGSRRRRGRRGRSRTRCSRSRARRRGWVAPRPRIGSRSRTWRRLAEAGPSAKTPALGTPAVVTSPIA